MATSFFILLIKNLFNRQAFYTGQFSKSIWAGVKRIALILPLIELSVAAIAQEQSLNYSINRQESSLYNDGQKFF